jgi:NAD(P)-dependent dehydrogenase (short-subunit alcohol dehydrogenase family)
MQEATMAGMDTDRVVVITGGSSGVGRAAARAFAETGHRVALVARGADALEATAGELRRLVPYVKTCVADVSDAKAVEAVADEVEREWGHIDVWVNAAAAVVLGRFTDIETDDFDRVVDVVLGGTVNGTRAALRSMVPRNSGRIVQVGSAVVMHGVPLQSAYVSAKHAVHGFSDSLRAELLHDGSAVTVSEVNLPAVNTPLYRAAKNLLPQRVRPFPPIYQPEDAASGILHAARSGARRVDVGGTTTAMVWADVFLAGVLEHLLGHVGFDLQQLGRADDQPTADALYSPLPGDHGCHGEYDDLARTRSVKELLRQHLLPERTVRVADQSRRLAAAALADLAVRTGIVPRR